MHWTTFYSYKGGVGRTSSLWNVAAELATRGRTAVVVDFDFEAPGAHYWIGSRPDMRLPRRSFYEFFAEYGEIAGSTSAWTTDPAFKPKAIREHATQLLKEA